MEVVDENGEMTPEQTQTMARAIGDIQALPSHLRLTAVGYVLGSMLDRSGAGMLAYAENFKAVLPEGGDRLVVLVAATTELETRELAAYAERRKAAAEGSEDARVTAAMGDGVRRAGLR